MRELPEQHVADLLAHCRAQVHESAVDPVQYSLQAAALARVFRGEQRHQLHDG